MKKRTPRRILLLVLGSLFVLQFVSCTEEDTLTPILADRSARDRLRTLSDMEKGKSPSTFKSPGRSTPSGSGPGEVRDSWAVIMSLRSAEGYSTSDVSGILAYLKRNKIKGGFERQRVGKEDVYLIQVPFASVHQASKLLTDFLRKNARSSP